MNIFRVSLMALVVAVPAFAQTTGSTGQSAPVPLGQPGLGLVQVMALSGSYPLPNGDSGSLAVMHTFAGNFAPNEAGWADGTASLTSENASLFNIIGTTFGGDGGTEFVLPDLRGRFLVGTGTAPGVGTVMNGQAYGRDFTSLGTSMPMHFHSMADLTRVTSTAGASHPFEFSAPTLAMTAMIAVVGIFPSMNSSTGLTFLGEIRWFGGNVVPNGWLPADGRLLAIAQNQALFAVVGTMYGGDGVTNFALPDLRARVAVGSGLGAGLSPVAVGMKWGAASSTLTSAQLPTHSHTVAGEGPTLPAGSSQSMTTAQPSLGITWLVATAGIFPQRGGGGGLFDSTAPLLGEVIAFAGQFAPRGYSKAEGQLIPIQQNTALFSILGTQFGGNGQATFGLPDLRGRTPVGAGGSSPIQVGEFTGNQSLTLQVAQLTAHVHSYVALPVDAGIEVDAGTAHDAGLEVDAGAIEDAGVIADAGTIEDAGVIVDAGTTEDAGVEADAGTTEDAGVIVDAGSIEDAGVIADAGTTEDAGVIADAGTTEDAGVVVADAGITSDAGVVVTDGGTDEPMEPMGCGCNSSSGASALFGLLAMLALRRRRRS